jgi:transposase
MNKQVWLGIDVAKETFHAGVAGANALPKEWSKLPHADFPHSPEGMELLEHWLEEQHVYVEGVCIEATGRLSQKWIALAADRFGAVSMINPSFGVAFGKSLGIRSKSDRIDACVLALYGKQNEPAPVRPASPEHQELRELSRALEDVQAQYRANQQRLSDGPASTSVRATFQRVQKCLSGEIKRLHQAMAAVVSQTPTLAQDVRRITTVKGIGVTTATTLVAEFWDLRTYSRNEIVALAGLYGREYDSGKSVHKKTRMVKTNKTQVRCALYMCAMSAVRSNPHLKHFAKRLEQNGKKPMQVLGAVMRKLLLIARAVVVTGKDYDPNYGAALQC